MPPPSPSERWYTGRHFGIVIDAGSSGSRLQIYSWINPRISKSEARLPRVEKGTENSEDWIYKVEPGISTFSENPSDIANYLRPLLLHAQAHIPPSLHHETPLFLLATAGMRLLLPQDQARILEEACLFLSRHSDFKIDKRGEEGPCGKSVRIITGEEEGLFGWIAVNYLVDSFSSSPNQTYGFLDMGGASTQIAFEPSSEEAKAGSPLVDVRLRLLNGEILNHRVFVTTWLGYGTNQARERYVDHLLSSSTSQEVQDPCLPQNLTLPSSSRTLLGTGSFKSCLNTTLPLLNNTTPCPDSPCLMNGIHVPKIDFSVDHFIGVSEYWFSSEHIFGLGGPYSFTEYESAAVRFCSRPWDDILLAHEKLVNGTGGDPHLGDGEVEDENGRIVEVGKWDPAVEISRLEMQCFKAAWIVNVLHEGIGVPRIVDSPSHFNSSSDSEEGGKRIELEASQKGLGRPTFQSAETIGDIAITWTLGKMVLEASKEIPGASSSSQSASPETLKDPLDEEVSQDPNFPIQKINPPWTLNITSPFHPSSLKSLGYGYPSIVLLIWVSIFLVLLMLGAGPVRRAVRGGCLRALRHLTAGKRRREVYNLNLEDGVALGGGSPTRNRLMSTFSKMFSSSSSSQTRPERFSPRTFSFVAGNHNQNPPNGTDGPNLNPTAAASAISISRSPSPIPLDAETFPGSVPIPFGIGGGNGGGLAPRSRNTSQGSLRGYAYSRAERA